MGGSNKVGGSTADHCSGNDAVLHDLEETCKTMRNHLREQRVVV